MKQLVIVADDLTGACDSGAYLCEYTDNVVVNVDSAFVVPAIANNKEQFVVNTQTRTIPAVQSYAKLYTLGTKLNALTETVFFKKIDTAYRGNVATELNALLDSMHNVDFCFLINAIPSMQRTTLGGYQLINGTRIAETEFANDPINKITESHIPSLLQKNSAARQVGSIPLQLIRTPALLNHVVEQLDTQAILVFDCCTEEDIRLILDQLLPTYQHNALWVGSLGLIQALGRYLFKQNPFAPQTDALQLRSHRTVGYTSSAHPTTGKQIMKAEQSGALKALEFDVVEMGAEVDHLQMEHAIGVCRRELAEGNIFIRAKVDRQQAVPGLQHSILNGLNVLARLIVEDESVDKVVLVGGDTSYSILTSLGIYEIRLLSKMEQAIALGVIHHEKMKRPKYLFIKGGSVGSEDAITKMFS
jgi:uncharacterized protein YgbK (DUF1537 family)